MPYIQRSPAGDVVALFLAAPEPGAEWLAVDHPDVLIFLNSSDTDGQSELPHNVLATLDRAMIRVLEDLVDVLVDKQIISLVDLPEQARTKVIARKQFRSTLPGAHNARRSSGMDDIV
jgi:hypothetical protein